MEGLTDIKLYEIGMYMRSNNIDVMCMQETRKKLSDNFITFFGYSVHLSGSSGDAREWAGVGFIVAPRVRKFMVGFTLFSNRVASFALKCCGWMLCDCVGLRSAQSEIII